MGPEPRERFSPNPGLGGPIGLLLGIAFVFYVQPRMKGCVGLIMIVAIAGKQL